MRVLSDSDSDLVLLEQSPGYDRLLDLAGALTNQQERRISVQPLDRELFGIPVAPMNPQGLGADLVTCLRCEKLRHRGIEVASLARGFLGGSRGEHQLR